MEQKANITIDKEHITVERTQTACGREIRVISVFPRHGSETVEDKANEISHTIVNAVAINSGMVCDGAKASCAAKIASAVEAGLLGMQMQMQGEQFYGGDGIVVKGVENTIRNVGRLARFGMAETDREIIDMMVSSQPQRC